MIINFTVTLVISFLTNKIFSHGWLSKSLDFLGHELLEINEENRNAVDETTSKCVEDMEKRRELMRLTPMPSRCSTRPGTPDHSPVKPCTEPKGDSNFLQINLE